MMALPVYGLLMTALIPRPPGVSVCTNTACKKGGSMDTLLTLRVLAACSRQASEAQTTSSQGRVALATLQEAFAATRVDTCGCLGGCGSGPNCYLTDAGIDEVLHDVYKPKSAVALLEAVGLDVPEPAVKAWLRRMYAVRALRSNDPKEAIAILSEALVEAAPLKGNGAHLLSHLLELRSDVHVSVGNQEAAQQDSERAARIRGLMPEAATV